jgi:alpha-1,2-mannosyltransferase
LDEYSYLLEPSGYLSLLLESWGTLRLAFTALQLTLQSGGLLTVPHVWIDTTGAAFTYLPARILFGCQVVAYVHYPTISTDMLRRVWQTTRTSGRESSTSADDDDNDTTSTPTSSTTTTRSLVKCIYYILFAVLYGVVGSLASLVLTNSTWTYNHIQSLWKYAAWRKRIRIVYPPCRFPSVNTIDTDQTDTNDANENNHPPRTFPPAVSSSDRKTNAIVSIGQFRPEKDHVLQLQVMARLLKQHPEWKHQTPKCQLVLIGSCRDDKNNDTNSDWSRLDKLRELAKKMGIEDYVEFVVNQPFEVVQKWLHEGSVGIHTVRSSTVYELLYD